MSCHGCIYLKASPCLCVTSNKLFRVFRKPAKCRGNCLFASSLRSRGTAHGRWESQVAGHHVSRRPSLLPCPYPGTQMLPLTRSRLLWIAHYHPLRLMAWFPLPTLVLRAGNRIKHCRDFIQGSISATYQYDLPVPTHGGKSNCLSYVWARKGACSSARKGKEQYARGWQPCHHFGL